MAKSVFLLLQICTIVVLGLSDYEQELRGYFSINREQANPANLVLLTDAVNYGAVCLDGSPPGT